MLTSVKCAAILDKREQKKETEEKNTCKVELKKGKEEVAKKKAEERARKAEEAAKVRENRGKK